MSKTVGYPDTRDCRNQKIVLLAIPRRRCNLEAHGQSALAASFNEISQN